MVIRCERSNGTASTVFHFFDRCIGSFDQMHEILLIFRIFRDGTTDGHGNCGTVKVNWVLLQVMKEAFDKPIAQRRSEEHTSELQSRENLVCRLLLEKK